MAADEAAYEAAVAAFLAVSEDCHLSLVNCGKPDLVAELGRLACRTNFAPLWSCPTYLTLNPEEEADEEGADEEEEELEEPFDAEEQSAEEEEEESDELSDDSEQSAVEELDESSEDDGGTDQEEEEETHAAPPRLAAGRDASVWGAGPNRKRPMPQKKADRNLLPGPKPGIKRCDGPILRRLTDAAIKADPMCRNCRKNFGKTLDHDPPVSWTDGVCPAYLLRSYKARENLVLADTVMRLFCDPCHHIKTGEDTKRMAQMARSTVPNFLVRMDLIPGVEWNVAEFRRQFPPAKLQSVLEKQWHEDRRRDNENPAMYEIGARHGMPVFECMEKTCRAKTESSKYSWAQNTRDGHAQRREYATILKPTCHKCRGTTFPIVCGQTKLPHYSAFDIEKILTDMETKGLEWLKPADAAELEEWRRKYDAGLAWISW